MIRDCSENYHYPWFLDWEFMQKRIRENYRGKLALKALAKLWQMTFNFFINYFSEKTIKTWHFMWIICLRQMIHMSSLIFSEKNVKKNKNVLCCRGFWINSFLSSGHFCRLLILPLQTVWTQIRPDKTFGLIWIQTVWHWWYSWKIFWKKWYKK